VVGQRVKLGEKESGLRAAFVADYIAWHGVRSNEEVLKGKGMLENLRKQGVEGRRQE